MKELTCIVCPKGCHLQVDDTGAVSGNACPRGKEYGFAEITNPTRMLTTTIRIEGAVCKRLPVKTSQPIPKERMMEVMELLSHHRVQAPVKLGDVIIPDVLATGADIVACRSL